MLYGRVVNDQFQMWEDGEKSQQEMRVFNKMGIYRVRIIEGVGHDYLNGEYWYHYTGIEKTLDDIKAEKIQVINDYDSSKEVNSFWFYDQQMWIDVELRGRLQNSTKIAIKNNRPTVVYWHENRKFEFPSELFLTMLDALEMYALECFNVTAQHIANVQNLETKEEIEMYDYKTGYPEKLNFTPQSETEE